MIPHAALPRPGVAPGPAQPPQTEEPALNAAAADQRRLLDLQALDSRIDQLAHRLRNLPERAEVEKLDRRLGQLRDVLVAAQAAEQDIAVEQRKAESDVDQVRARAVRDQQRLDSGAITSPRELENLQHEIASLAKRQSDLEDLVLDVMERREAAQQRAKDLADQARQAEESREAAKASLAASVADNEAEAGKLTEQRAEVAREIPDDLLALYERLRASSAGVGAAALRQRRCEGCRLELDISELNSIRTAPEDAVVRCDSCRRILVRIPESGL